MLAVMAWTELPSLRGDLVVLDPLRADDAAALFVAADDDAVFRWLSRTRPRTHDEMADWVADALASPAQHPWVQRDAASGDVVGTTSFYDVDERLRTVAIGHTWLSRGAWRTGINTEAKLLLLTHAFDTLGCVRVVWHTDHLNARSQAAIERLGATREGVLRKHRIRPDGTWRDTVTYALLDEEWPDARAALAARLERARTVTGGPSDR